MEERSEGRASPAPAQPWGDVHRADGAGCGGRDVAGHVVGGCCRWGRRGYWCAIVSACVQVTGSHTCAGWACPCGCERTRMCWSVHGGSRLTGPASGCPLAAPVSAGLSAHHTALAMPPARGLSARGGEISQPWREAWGICFPLGGGRPAAGHVHEQGPRQVSSAGSAVAMGQGLVGDTLDAGGWAE